MSTPPRAAYIHVPFCRHRCGYCNFTVVAKHQDLQTPYLNALERELQWLGEPHEVDTIYIGGGTPTELSDIHLDQLCQLVRRSFPPAPSYEWTIEANPYALAPRTVQLLAKHGVNRISLGVQSFNDSKLKTLERDHRLADILTAYHLCRDHFASVSLDLMFAAPGESTAVWQRDVAQAIDLHPDHLSVYGLTFEKGARFWGALARGHLTELGEDQQRRMCEFAIDQLTQNGWEHYEVSNFARPGHHSRHNVVYWTGNEYYAAGPGAARYVKGQRQTNHRSTFTYIRRVLSGHSPVNESETLTAEERARERLVFGLRMLAGIGAEQFAQETGFTVQQLVAKPLKKFIELKLLEDTGTHIRLTRRGLFISDALWPEFL